MTSSSEEHTVRLQDGTVMPILGFGTWQIQGKHATQAVNTALQVGYRHIDTATVYENEKEVGQALNASGLARDELFITTKIPPYGAREAARVIEKSLRDLGVDYVDLWLIHWPPARSESSVLWEAMLQIQQAGLVKNLGVSNFAIEEIDLLVEHTGVVPAVNQIRWSPFLFDAAEAHRLQERQIVLEGYSPFKTSRLRDQTLTSIASAHGVSPAQVVLRWHIQHGFVAIPKSVHNERIMANFDVFSFELDQREMDRLDQLSS